MRSLILAILLLGAVGYLAWNERREEITGFDIPRGGFLPHPTKRIVTPRVQQLGDSGHELECDGQRCLLFGSGGGGGGSTTTMAVGGGGSGGQGIIKLRVW